MHTASRLVGFALLALLIGVSVPFSFAAADGYWYNNQWYPSNYSNSYPYSYGQYGNYGNYSHDYYRQPTCTITLSNYSRVNGYPPSATLSWYSTNAKSAYLSSVGSVSTSDTRTVYPYGQSYTLTVTGPGGTATCTATNTDTAYQYDYYRPNYTHYGNYYTPTYTYSYVQPTYQPYVYLDKLPYTGFDYGAFGNSLYWAVLMSLAVVGSYLMFYMFGMRVTFVESVAQAAHNQLALVKRVVRG